MNPRQHSSGPVREGPGAETDAALMRSVRGGDTGAFELLVDRYWRLTVLYAQSVGGADRGPDIAQETFSRLWQRRDQWVEGGSVRAWILRTARNLALGELRRDRVRLRWTGRGPNPESPQATPLQEVERAELRSAIQGAVARLSPRRREVFTLFYLQDLSYSETAEIMNIRPQSVANYLQAALADLRASLASFFPELARPPEPLPESQPESEPKRTERRLSINPRGP